MTSSTESLSSRVLLLFLGFFMLAGCSTSVLVSGSVPAPKLERLPFSVGIYFSETFKQQVHERTTARTGKWTVDFSDQSLQMMNSILTHSFIETIEVGPLDSQSGLLESSGAVDGYIEPRISKYEFLVPRLSGLNFFSASIHYEILLYDRERQLVTSWKAVGYGKSEIASQTPGQALAAATLDAIRDGTGRLGIELTAGQRGDNGDIQNWLSKLAIKR